MRFLDDPDTKRLRRVIDAIAEHTGLLHTRSQGHCRCDLPLNDAADHRRHLHAVALKLGVLP